MPEHKTTSKSPIVRLRKSKAADKAFMAAVGERIRKLRVARNWTFREFRDLTGVPISVLFAIEHGEASATITTLQKIAATLEVSVADLLNAAGDDAGVLMEMMRKQRAMVAVIGERAKEIKERAEWEAVERFHGIEVTASEQKAVA